MCGEDWRMEPSRVGVVRVISPEPRHLTLPSGKPCHELTPPECRLLAAALVAMAAEVDREIEQHDRL